MSVDMNQIDQCVVSLLPNNSQWNVQADNVGGYQLVQRPTSFGSQFLSRLETAEGGPFRFLQALDKICGLSAMFVKKECLSRAAKVFNSGWTATIYADLPRSFFAAKKSAESLGSVSSIPGDLRRKCVSALQDGAKLISGLGYAVVPLLPNSSNKDYDLKAISLFSGAVGTAIADVCDLQKESESVMKARSLAGRAELLAVSPEITNTLKETGKYHFLRMMKAACSVGGLVLGFGLNSTGALSASKSAMLAASLSLAGTLFAASAGLYKEGMKYKPVDFFDSRHVQYVSTSA